MLPEYVIGLKCAIGAIFSIITSNKIKESHPFLSDCSLWLAFLFTIIGLILTWHV